MSNMQNWVAKTLDIRDKAEGLWMRFGMHLPNKPYRTEERSWTLHKLLVNLGEDSGFVDY